MQSEEKLIKDCIKHDRKAQKMLYDKYSHLLMGICFRYLHSRQAAEDVLQEVFVKIFKSIGQYEGKGSFEGWLKRITVNTAISYIRKNQKHDYQLDIQDVHETDFEGFSFKDSDFTREELFKVVQSLPTGYRTIFNLYAIEGYKHREIAEMLEVDINTSKSQFSRARKILQDKLLSLKNYNTNRE